MSSATQIDPVFKEAIVASIRLEYLKLAIVVILVIVIIWYVYSRYCLMQNMTTEKLHLKYRTNEPALHQSSVPYQSAWLQTHSKTGIARVLGDIGNSAKKITEKLQLKYRTNEPALHQSSVPYQSAWQQTHSKTGIARELGDIGNSAKKNTEKLQLKYRTNEPALHQSSVPYQSAWQQTHSKTGIARELGNIDGKEEFAPYASWLTPDIYRSDPAHDDNISNDSHYGMYAPYNLDYIFPSNIELPEHRYNRIKSESFKSTNGEPNVFVPYGQGPPEHMDSLNQHNFDTDEVAGEYDVPERQVESEAGLLFGISNYDDSGLAEGGPL